MALLLALSFLNIYGHLEPGAGLGAMDTQIKNYFSSRVSRFLKGSYLQGSVEPSTGPATGEAFSKC